MTYEELVAAIMAQDPRVVELLSDRLANDASEGWQVVTDGAVGTPGVDIP